MRAVRLQMLAGGYTDMHCLFDLPNPLVLSALRSSEVAI